MKIKNNKYFSLILLIFILSFSAFFRLFRLDQLLGFWYDQGRDALVIWDFIHNHKFFLIGPVTGIEGIFLGPFYYLLLAPLYFIGKGSPVFVAAGLSWLTVLAIYLIYKISEKIYGKEVGIIASLLYGFSFNLIVFSRWLANPNPLPFFTLLVIWFLYKFIDTHNSLFLIIDLFLVGLCLQLEAAAAIFFLPSILFVLIWQRKKIKSVFTLGLSFGAFLITLIPQLYFNFRHEGVLFNAFRKFLITDQSFKISFLLTIEKRLLFYYDTLFGKLFPSGEWLKIFALALFSATLIIFRKKIFNVGGKLLLIWFIVPIIGFFFYQGNHGYVWDYYLTGIIPAFIILFSAGLFNFFKKWLLSKVIVISFLILFMIVNIKLIKTYFITGIGITLRAQTWAMDWVYKDIGKEKFNIDAYVPPQIYYSYSYLFRWYGIQEYGREPEEKLVKSLYTLYEPDSEHPQFLDAWLKRQDKIGKIIKSDFWGDITVQKRERILYDE